MRKCMRICAHLATWNKGWLKIRLAENKGWLKMGLAENKGWLKMGLASGAPSFSACFLAAIGWMKDTGPRRIRLGGVVYKA